MVFEFASDHILQAVTFSIVPVIVLMATWVLRSKEVVSLPEDKDLTRLRELMSYVRRNLMSVEQPIKDPETVFALYNVMRTLESVHCDLLVAKARDPKSGELAEIIPHLERLVKELVDNQRMELQLEYEEIV